MTLGARIGVGARLLIRICAFATLALGTAQTLNRVKDVLGPWAGHDDHPASMGERVAYYITNNLSDALLYASVTLSAAGSGWLLATVQKRLELEAVKVVPLRPFKTLSYVCLGLVVAGVLSKMVGATLMGPRLIDIWPTYVLSPIFLVPSGGAAIALWLLADTNVRLSALNQMDLA